VAVPLHNSFGFQLSLCTYWEEQSWSLLNAPCITALLQQKYNQGLAELCDTAQTVYSAEFLNRIGTIHNAELGTVCRISKL